MKRNNGEGTIYHIKSKNIWSAQISIGKDENGKLIRKTVYGRTRKEVQDKLFEIQSHVITKSMIASKKITLNQWIEEYFRAYKVHTMKKTTYETEFARFKAEIYPSDLGQMYINDIKPIDIQHFIMEKQEKYNHRTKQKGISNKTISNILILINSSLKQAEKENLIYKNPCISIAKPKIEKPSVIALDEKEIEIFKKAISGTPYEDIFLFAMQTGMRQSEICGLTNDCIDLKNKEIRVEKQLAHLNKKFVFESPKTENSIRYVPMTPLVYDICKKYKKNNKEPMFRNPTNSNILLPRTLSRALKMILKPIENKSDTFKIATFHSLRHTFATHFLRCGGNAVMLAKILGHSNANFTIKTYIQPSNNDIHEAMNKIKF